MNIALDLLARVSLLLGAGLVAGLLLHRNSAAVRHLVLAATLGGSLVMTVLVPWTPRLELALAWWRQERPQELTTTQSSNLAGIPEAIATSVANAPTPESGPWPAFNGPNAAEAIPLWLMVWAAGTALLLGWTAWGRLGLSRLRRRAACLTSGPWADAVASVAVSCGVSRPIALFTSNDVGAPMTWGALGPVLMLPAESPEWTDDLRRSVVAHEVAHVARQDYLVQLMATIACAVYWFHPLAWMTARRLRQAAEKACDDQVLSLGTSGEDYARHLIGIARNSRSLRLSGAVAIGMARPTTLEGRIMAVLDSARVRATPSARGRLFTMLATVTALVLFGAIQPVPAAARNVVTAPAVYVEPEPEPEVKATAPPVAVRLAPSVVVQGGEQRQGQDQSREDIVNASPGEQLTIDLDAPGGSVTVRGWDDSRVRVRTRLGGANWRDVEVKVERLSNGVRVGSRFVVRSDYQSTHNEFEINVPRRFDIRVSSGGGPITLLDIEGRFSGHTGGGEITFERLKGSSSLTTGGGEIRVTDSDLSGRVSTGGGTVVLSRVSGGLRATSGSGPVITADGGSGANSADLSSVNVSGGGSRIDVGSNTTYRAGSLNISKSGGDITLNAVPNGGTIHTGGGDVRVGATGGDVSVSTGGGSVSVGPASGSVRAGTGAGEVHVIVDRVTNDQVIEAWSGKGRVIIELPRDFDGRFELETAHTRTHESTARIRSDWNLTEEPLTDWIDRQGTPRRYLRASGRAGDGRARVIVRTVNGEIEIRRR